MEADPTSETLLLIINKIIQNAKHRSQFNVQNLFPKEIRPLSFITFSDLCPDKFNTILIWPICLQRNRSYFSDSRVDTLWQRISSLNVAIF
jgi:hypothetical protein